MGAPVYSVADFAAGLLQLLPTGRAWPRDASSVIGQVITSQAPSYERLHARANYLLADAFPSTTIELLPEWEATLGLPDPCAGPDQTIEQRQAHVVARLTQQDGPSIPSLTAYAAALGYTITITEFTTKRFGRRFGDRFYTVLDAFVWRVTTAIATQRLRRFGDVFGERYASTPSQVLECELRRLAPAHTVLVFSYIGSPVAAPLDEFTLDTNTLA